MIQKELAFRRVDPSAVLLQSFLDEQLEVKFDRIRNETATALHTFWNRLRRSQLFALVPYRASRRRCLRAKELIAWDEHVSPGFIMARRTEHIANAIQFAYEIEHGFPVLQFVLPGVVHHVFRRPLEVITVQTVQFLAGKDDRTRVGSSWREQEKSDSKLLLV
jgi:hypothetical protein